MRRCLVVLLVACFGWPPTPANAAPAVPRRIVVIAVPFSSPVAWRSRPKLQARSRKCAFALVSTRTDEGTSSPHRREAAFVTLGAGVRRAADAGGGALATSLSAAGVPFVASPSAQQALRATPLEPSVVVPPGLHPPAVAVVDADSINEADDMIAQTSDLLEPQDVLIAFTPAPERGGIDLGMICVVAREFGPGLLYSPSTRRTGIVTLTDVAPTILHMLGLTPVTKMDGRALEQRDSDDPLSTLESLEIDLVASASARRPMTRGVLVVAMALAFLAALLLARNVRVRSLSFFLLAAATSPLSLYVSGAFHPTSTDVFVVLVALMSLVVAGVLYTFLGFERALLAVLAASTIVPLVDLLVGTPVAMRSPLAFQIAGGGRFYGVDDGVLGVVVGAAIFAAALAIARAKGNQITYIAFGLAVAVWILGSPSFGAKLGAPLTAVPPFAVLTLRARGRRIDAKAIAIIIVATLAVTGALVLADAARSSGAQSHVARAIEGQSNAGSLIGRKWRTNWRITTHTIWAPAIAVFVGALVLGLRKKHLSEAMRAGLLAGMIGVGVGILFNDEGVITAAFIALYAATALLGAQHAGIAESS